MSQEVCIVCADELDGPMSIFGPDFAPQCIQCWLTVGINSEAGLEDLYKINDLYPGADRYEVATLLRAWEEEEEED
jgi:hypothetical protein